MTSTTPNEGGSGSNGGSTVRVDPDALIDKGQKLADLPGVAHGLFDILDKLSGALRSLGQPWGDDELGKHFSEGASGYLSAVDSLVGNASHGSDATGAIPVYAQLLVNYGTTITEAGKAFAGGEDLYAQWILKSYIDADAHGNPGPYTGPLSSDPEFGKGGSGGGSGSGTGTGGGSGDKTGPTGSPQYRENSGGGTNPGGSVPGAPGPDDLTALPDPYKAPTPDPSSARALSSGIDPSNPDMNPDTPYSTTTGPGTSYLDGIPDPEVSALPGALGPNGFVPSGGDPRTGESPGRTGGPVVPTGASGAGTPTNGLGTPVTRTAGDGDKSTKPGPGTRSTLGSGAMTPSVPSMPGGAAGTGASEGKGKRRERRTGDARPEGREGEPVDGDPWQRFGWPTGGR
ncbi:hypothetical protein [Nocardia sp. NPDC005366]|uniref:hypothetical protein n=1 Tax=Nocardia sp. NPDC005366 TaxID=3156878 RepID=UPI0033A3885F